MLPALTSTVRLSIKDFGRAKEAQAKVFRDRVLTKAMPAASRAVKSLLEAETRARGIVDRGKFAKSWKVEVGTPPLSARVVNTQPYAIVIEKGRRKGRRPPPVSAIEPWVRRKLIIGANQSVRSVAFAVARAIGERGIKARPILGDPAVMARTKKLVVSAVVAQVRKSITTR